MNSHSCKKRKRLVAVANNSNNNNNDTNNNVNHDFRVLRKRAHASADDSANVKIYGVAASSPPSSSPPPSPLAPKQDRLPALVTREVVVPVAVLDRVPLASIADSAGVVIANGSTPDAVSVTGYSCNVVEACAALLPAVASALLERAEQVAAVNRPPSPQAMRGECVICFSDEALLCCVPCGHLALCERDAVAVAASRQCPVCRRTIDNLLRVYRSSSSQ